MVPKTAPVEGVGSAFLTGNLSKFNDMNDIGRSQPQDEITFIDMKTIKPEMPDWLWKDWLAAGELNLVVRRLRRQPATSASIMKRWRVGAVSPQAPVDGPGAFPPGSVKCSKFAPILPLQGKADLSPRGKPAVDSETTEIRLLQCQTQNGFVGRVAAARS
jgi:hypothetical protein